MALAGVLGGCGAPPGYALSWTLIANEAADDSGVALDSVRQCSEVGISQVRVTATPRNAATSLDTVPTEGTDFFIDEYPCFPGSVDGPVLEPGVYDLVIEGLRRTGEPWEFDPELDAEELRIAYAEAELTVVEGQEPTPIELVLRAPPECDDGIDNDGDGRVDRADPACLVDNPTQEALDGAASVVQAELRMLASDSTLTRPLNLGIHSFELEAVGASSEGDPATFNVSQANLDYSRTPFRLPLLAAILDDPDSSYEVTLTGLDAGGVALTGPIVAEVPEGGDSVPSLQNNTFVGEFVVRPEDFLAPVSLSALFSQVLRRNEDNATQPCAAGGLLASGLDALRVRVVDQDGTPLDVASLGLGGGALDPAQEGEWIRFACPLAPMTTAALDWGTYEIQLEGLVGDEVCFHSGEGEAPAAAAIELVPSLNTSAQIITLERVLVDGAVPAACQECSGDAECESAEVCDNNICVPETFSDG